MIIMIKLVTDNYNNQIDQFLLDNLLGHTIRMRDVCKSHILMLAHSKKT